MFGDNSEGRVLGYGKIAITIDHSISKVLLVDSLDYILLSVSHFVRRATIICSLINV
jgi:hypothetical protein